MPQYLVCSYLPDDFRIPPFAKTAKDDAPAPAAIHSRLNAWISWIIASVTVDGVKILDLRATKRAPKNLFPASKMPGDSSKLDGRWVNPAMTLVLFHPLED